MRPGRRPSYCGAYETGTTASSSFAPGATCRWRWKARPVSCMICRTVSSREFAAEMTCSIPLAIAGFAFYLWRGAMTKGLGLNGTDLLLGACAGALGAWLSVATRLGRSDVDQTEADWQGLVE